jgi:hypothetical protein
VTIHDLIVAEDAAVTAKAAAATAAAAADSAFAGATADEANAYSQLGVAINAIKSPVINTGPDGRFRVLLPDGGAAFHVIYPVPDTTPVS